jgi:hypothetical protein
MIPKRTLGQGLEVSPSGWAENKANPGTYPEFDVSRHRKP